MPEQDPSVRAKNFMEVPLGFSTKTAQLEAQRCLNCKIPKCKEGCPVYVKIPEFLKLIVEGDFAAAARKIKETNALPAVCGRVCPQESQCEATCILGKKGDPVAIGRLERFVADYERENNLIKIPKKQPAKNKKVAVVGSGPSGLTVAGDLIKLGYDVTIFEALHKPGGVLIYGIPEFRLPKAIVEAEVDYLVKQGVKLKLNKVIGASRTVEDLFKRDGFDAVFLGVGAGLPRFMNIEGENLSNVYSANEYLTRINLMKAYLYPEHYTPIALGRNVTVVGGGNVTMDSARCALRTGAQKVTIVYRRAREQMPARGEEIHHAEEEGIILKLLNNPVELIGDEKGAVKKMRCIKMKLGEPDESGRKRPVPIEGSEFTLNTDLVIMGIGAGANPLLTSTMPDLELNKWGYIVADENGRTSMEGIWAGGDIVTGSATVIQAMGAGKQAAKAIDSYIKSGK
ncbi:MAG: NADPH-dependent glutamate synthase [Thermoplasmatales archaeon]|nr:MAG: NADPH-dependent glutamate synthase [Thermoplasmatales archaeon]